MLAGSFCVDVEARGATHKSSKFGFGVAVSGTFKNSVKLVSNMCSPVSQFVPDKDEFVRPFKI
jgi:hypothetical protein